MTSKRKREYLDDFVVSEDGSYEYQGKLWKWDRPADRTAFVREASLLLTGAGACLLAAGFIPTTAMGNAFYVLLPYVLMIGISAYAVSCIVRIARSGERMRDRLHEKAILELPIWLMVGCIGGVAGAIGEALQMILAGTPMPLGTVFTLLLLGAAACLARLRKRIVSLSMSAL